MLILNDDDTRASFPMHKAIGVQKEAFRQLQEGLVDVPPRAIVPLVQNSERVGTGLYKPCVIDGGCGGMGLKVVHVMPGNAERGQPTVPACIMLFDKDTGFPQCVMNATWLTAVRTAAGSGLATDYFAKENASNLVVFGAGLQAEAHIQAVCSVRPISKVTVINRSLKRAEGLKEKMESYANVWEHCKNKQVPEFTLLRSLEVAKVESAVNAADVICTTTGSSNPVLKGEWIRPGTHINGVGSYLPSASELDEVAVKRSRILVDTEHAFDAGDLKNPLQSGAITKETHLIGSMGEYVCNQCKEKVLNPNLDLTFFKSVGTAVQDISSAYAVYETAKENNIGQVGHL